MNDPLLIVLVSVVATVVVVGLAFALLGGVDVTSINLARRIRVNPELAAKVELLLNPPPPVPPKPVKPSAAPIRALALLQREGRLLDFLLENIQDYPDAQVGAAVRDIHRKCQLALKEHLVLEPVLPQAEGATVEVASGFDPSAVRLTGNVTGQPPFKGTLQHHGWRVKEIRMTAPPEGQDEFVLMPAEVELP